MYVRSDLYNDIVFEISLKEMASIVKEMKKEKEKDIGVIKDKIHKYEQKRRSEEAWYQSLSPFRRLFTGRAPSHHQAVEHMMNVKERYRKIDAVKQQVAILDDIIQTLEEDSGKEEIILPASIIELIRTWRKEEGMPR